MPVKTDEAVFARMLHSYGINTPVADERFTRHADLEKGIPFTIDAWDDAYFGRNVGLTIGCRHSVGPSPLNELEAERLVEEFRIAHLLPGIQAEGRALSHLLVKCAHMYADACLNRLHLTGHLTPRGYRINDVHMSGGALLDAVPRLDPHAHDRGAVFPWRRTARLRPRH